MSHSTSDIAALLSERGHLYVLIKEYGATHGYLLLALHDGSYPRAIELGCRDCTYISGPTHGGPYRWHVTTEELSESEEVITLSGNAGEFVVKCGAIKIERVRD